jgi:plastocyanin
MSGRRTISLAGVLSAMALALVLTAAPALAASAVVISNFAYVPPSITVPAGTTVTWTDHDPFGHSVTSDTGAFDSSPSNCSPTQSTGCLQPNGGTFSFTFSSPGTFTYHCRVHSFMHGTIIVTAVTTTTAPPATTVPTTAPPATTPGTSGTSGTTPTTAAPGTGTGTSPTVAAVTATTTPSMLANTGVADLGRLGEIAAALALVGGIAVAGAARQRGRLRS